jgi:hypothetical protein
MIAQLEKERETRHALQEQCAFLGQELFKLETDLKHQKLLVEEQKNKILDRNNAAPSTSPGLRSYLDFAASEYKNSRNNNSTGSINNGNGSTSGNFSSVAEDNVQVRKRKERERKLKEKGVSGP